jgi:hypothetical protein
MVWMIYLLGSIEGFLGVLCFVMIASLSSAGILALFIGNGDVDEDKWPVVKKLIVMSVVSMVIFVATPNSKTIAAMYLLPKIVANEHVQRIPDKALTVLEKKLDAYLGSFDEKEKE